MQMCEGQFKGHEKGKSMQYRWGRKGQQGFGRKGKD
jgi:hypothetical protein